MEEPASPRSAGLRLLLEIGPLVIFFAVNSRAGIYVGTAAFMVAITLSLVVSRVIEKRFPIMPLVTAGFVLVFGGLTLVLQDELFIKLKPTIVNALFSAILLGGLLTGRSLLQPVLGAGFALTEAGWRLLTLRWGVFFAFLALLNELAWRMLSTDAWLRFKIVAIVPLTLVFALLQTGLLRRHALAEGSDAPRGAG